LKKVKHQFVYLIIAAKLHFSFGKMKKNVFLHTMSCRQSHELQVRAGGRHDSCTNLQLLRKFVIVFLDISFFLLFLSGKSEIHLLIY